MDKKILTKLIEEAKYQRDRELQTTNQQNTTEDAVHSNTQQNPQFLNTLDATSKSKN